MKNSIKIDSWLERFAEMAGSTGYWIRVGFWCPLRQNFSGYKIFEQIRLVSWDDMPRWPVRLEIVLCGFLAPPATKLYFCVQNFSKNKMSDRIDFWLNRYTEIAGLTGNWFCLGFWYPQRRNL